MTQHYSDPKRETTPISEQEALYLLWYWQEIAPKQAEAEALADAREGSAE